MSEYAIVHERLGQADLKKEEVYSLSGEDRTTFLNAYLTQDIEKLPPNRAAYGAFLTQKGKLVSDVWVVHLPEKFLLFFPKNFGEKVQAHLSTFLLFSQSALEPMAGPFQHVALLGEQAEAFLKQKFPGFQSTEIGVVQNVGTEKQAVYLWNSLRLGLKAWEVFTTQASLPWNASELPTIGENTLEILRIEAVLPKIGVDMGEDNLVAEVGLDQSAISFNKGCYLGQETTARLNSMGHVNRKLTLFKLPSSLVGPLPLEIWKGDKKVGSITSVVDSPKYGGPIGLGILHRTALETPGPILVKDGINTLELKIL